MKIVIYAFIIQWLFYSVVSGQAFRLETADFRLSISEIGQIKEMASPISGKNYLAPVHNAPILKIRIGNEWEEPSKAFFNSGKGLITLHFSKSGTDAEIKVEQKKTHMVFELIGVSPLEQINAVIWGSFPTLISKTIGEVVGVVRDDEYAIGLQSLNTKTLGGVLTNAEGADFTRGTVAIAQAYGSSLQAYSLDRSKPRKILVWDQTYPNIPVDLIPN